MDMNNEILKDTLSTTEVGTDRAGEESDLSPRDDDSLPMSFMVTDSTPRGDDSSEKNQGRNKQDEVFTDKDRAAAVVIGTKDIKAFLEHKKFVDQRKRYPEDYSASLFFNQAEFLMSQNKWAPALELINKALSLQADNKKWLVERARCYAQLSQMDHALNDVEEVLKVDHDYFPAICQKGEIMYALWDLEHALLYFHQGLQLRPGNVTCLMGVKKARMALEAELTEKKQTKKKKKKKETKKEKNNKSDTIKSFHSEIPSRTTFRFSSSLSMSSKLAVDSSFDQSFTQRSGKEVSKETAVESGFSDRSASRSPTVSNNLSGTKQLKVNRRKKRSAKPHGYNRDSAGIDRLSPSISDRPSPSISCKSSISRHRNSYSSRSKSPLFRRKQSDSNCSTSSEMDFRFSRSSSASTLKLSHQISTDLKQLRKEMAAEGFRQQDSMKKSKKKRKKKSVIPDKPNKLDQIETFDLAADQRFLESVLNNKDLKQGKSESIKKAFHMIREVYSFVSERQKYWDAETANNSDTILELQQPSAQA